MVPSRRLQLRSTDLQGAVLKLRFCLRVDVVRGSASIRPAGPNRDDTSSAHMTKGVVCTIGQIKQSDRSRGKVIMSSERMFPNLVITWLAGLSLAIFLVAGPARAQSSTANYVVLVGAGFLCESGDSSACPAVVKSAQGDSYEMSGAGTFATQSKSVTAAGTYTRKSSGGNVLETGVWVASELVSFDSYGIAPTALMREGRALGSPRFGPMRSRMFSGSMPAGGRAVFRLSLLPMWGPAKTATLEVNCALGKVPDEHPREGIRLTFEGRAAEFDEETSGRALFLMTRPGASAAAKAPVPEGDTNPAPAEATP